MRKVSSEEQKKVLGAFSFCGRPLNKHCAGYYTVYAGSHVRHKKWYQSSFHEDPYCCNPDGGIYTYG